LTIQGNRDRRISRRRFIGLGGMGAAALVLGGQGSVLARPRPGGTRPRITHGVQSGDVSTTGAIVWARTDRPSRMFVEVAPTESFRQPRIYKGPLVDESTDFAAQLDLTGLPSGQDVFYRVRFEDARTGRSGEPVFGTFRTPSTDVGGGVSFVWSGDTAGQGWGINPDFGGMRIYQTIRGVAPDFFIHSGDTVYADGPIQPSVTLPDGRIWRNILTEEKSKVAETLGEFRGNYKYNLLDENLKRFNAEVPMLAQWDDHETTNNWYPGEVLDDPRYTETNVDMLAARANRAFHEYMPIRQGVSDEEGRIYRKG
jgi:alkaline phosphatase D